MIIKHFYMWHLNGDSYYKEERLFFLIILSLAVSAIIGVFTYFGIGIFGPWYLGSQQTVFLGWLAPFLNMFYFWGRWARYASLRRQNRLNRNTGEIAGCNWFGWIKAGRDKKHQEAEMKLRERSVALGFANEIKKYTGGNKLI